MNPTFDGFGASAVPLTIAPVPDRCALGQCRFLGKPVSHIQLTQVHEDLARIWIALDFEGSEPLDRRSEGFHAEKVYGIFRLQSLTVKLVVLAGQKSRMSIGNWKPLNALALAPN